MTTLDLTVDIQNRKFYVNNRLATEVERFIFTRQDQVQFRVQPVKRNLAGGIRNPIEIVDVSPLDLQMAVGVWNAPYAAQVNWTKDEDNDWFTGTLNFNTVPLEDDQTGKFKAIPSPASIPAKFHVRFIDSGQPISVIVDCEIRNAVLLTGAPDPEEIDPPSALVANLALIFADSNSVDVQQSGNQFHWQVRRKTGSGLYEAADGLYVASPAPDTLLTAPVRLESPMAPGYQIPQHPTGYTQAVAGGVAGKVYEAALRVRGVAELKDYGGDHTGHFVPSGAPVVSGWDIWKLQVSDPAAVYYLNGQVDGLTPTPKVLDYTVFIPIAGGATLTLSHDSVDGSQGHNSEDLVVPDIPPAPAPFDGAFIQIDFLPGMAGTPGTDGEDAFVYVGYAQDANGTGFALTPHATRKYIAFRSSNVALTPVAADFTGLWMKYLGEDGAEGEDAFVYVGYAQDADGTGFALTPDATRQYIAFRPSNVALTPVAADFAGLLMKYIGEDGAPGSGGGGGSAETLAFSTAGTDTIAPASGVLNHFVDVTVSAGVGVYVRKLVLSNVGAADGKRVTFHFTLPASANPTLEIRDATDTGTLLLSFSPRADETVPRSVDCEFRSGAWRLVDTNEITDHVRESLLTAKGQMLVREANEVAALAAPATDEFLMGAPTTNGGMAWKSAALARAAMLKLYHENAQSPSPQPVANGDNALALGEAAYARDAGHIARANGGFNADAATAQRWEALLRNETTDATQTELFVDGAAQRLVLPDNYTWTFDIRIVAREQGGESAGYSFSGTIKRGTGAASVALVGTVDSPVADKEDTAAWAVTVDADTTNGSLRVRVTGGASQTLRWVAAVDVVEVFNVSGGGPPNSATALELALIYADDFYTPASGRWLAVNSTPADNQPPWSTYRVYYEKLTGVGVVAGDVPDPTTASTYVDLPVGGYSYVLDADPPNHAGYKARAWREGYALGPVVFLSF